MEIYPDFRDLLKLFNDHRVRYVVVGGYAVGHYGAPRYTGDIDLFVAPTEDNATRILAALEQFGFGSLALEAKDFSNPGRVVQLGYPPCRVDILTSIEGVSFEEASANPSAGDYGGVPIRFIGRDMLIRNKRSTGRAKDLADAESLDPP